MSFCYQLELFVHDLSGIGIDIHISKMDIPIIVHLLIAYCKDILQHNDQIFLKLKSSPMFKYFDLNNKYIQVNIDSIWQWLIVLTKLAVDYNKDNSIIYNIDQGIMIKI